MLINCPECELQVSDHALSCPHCGYPLKKDVPIHRQNKKRMRLPNGFGQISEIKGRNLRKPFRAMVSIGKSPTGRPICKPLKPESYFESYNDAYKALVEYHKNPADLESDMLMKDLFEKWSEEYFKRVKTPAPTLTAWAYCQELHMMRVADVRARHIKHCLEEGTAIIKGVEKRPTASVKNIIKTMMNQIFDYAVEYELVDRNYARTFKLSKEVFQELGTTKTEHKSYTDEEITILWKHAGEKYFADLVLVQCYSGWRPTEILSLKLTDIDLESGLMHGGIKTEAGKNRIVPIHSKIREIVKDKYNKAKKVKSPYLFYQLKIGNEVSKLTYDKYRNGLNDLIGELRLDPDHRPHDGRKHFVTQAKKANVDEYAIKYVVGHAISDVTEKVYTDREIEWLKTEIEKIK